MSFQQQGKSKEELDELRCTKYFDALWFCYSPVYQMKQYYVYGTVDDCKGHWSKWFNCLKQKTKFKDEVRRSMGQHARPISAGLPTLGFGSRPLMHTACMTASAVCLVLRARAAITLELVFPVATTWCRTPSL